MATATKPDSIDDDVTVSIRIEKRLKLTLAIEVMYLKSRDMFQCQVVGFDSKTKSELNSFDANELHTSKDAAALAGFDIAYSWVTDLQTQHGDRARYNAVLACIQEQAGKVQPGWTPPEIPETEEAAAAKEAAILSEETLLQLNPFLGSLDGPLPFDQVLTVPRDCILPSPDNPRDHFAMASLQELAASLKEHHQQQPITCFWNLARELEIIDGERRYRASELAKLPTVSIIIRDVTIAEAIELRGIANLEREDLTPVEVAKWQQQLIEKGNYTQRSLAKKLNVSQAKLAESLSLLKLPEAWQNLLITHVITPTHARALGKWKDREPLLAKTLEQVQDWRKDHDPETDDPLTVTRFEQMISKAIEKTSRPLAEWQCPFRVTPKNRDELDIVEIGGYLGKRAFNVAKWNELAKVARDRKKKADATPKKQSQVKRPAISDWALRRHRSDWFCEQIALKVEQLPKKEKLLPLQLLVMFSSVRAIDWDAAEEATSEEEVAFLAGLNSGEPPLCDIGSWKRELDPAVPIWRLIQQIDAKNRDEVIRSMLLSMLLPGHGCLPIDYLIAIATDLGVDFSSFVPTVELLNDYSEESLKEMPAYERIEDAKALSQEKLIDNLIVAWQPGEFPPGWWPEELERVVA